MLRGRFAWLVVLPKLELVGSRLGSLNCGWLKALRNSERNWSLILSLNENVLMTDKSQSIRGCPRKPGRCDGSVLILLANRIRGSFRCFAASTIPFVCTAAPAK